MIIGANIGTTVTNTLASLGSIRRAEEFRRAFEAATVHDFFNLLAVAVLFPLQLATGFLSLPTFFRCLRTRHRPQEPARPEGDRPYQAELHPQPSPVDARRQPEIRATVAHDVPPLGPT
jgi:hypothetical protein